MGLAYDQALDWLRAAHQACFKAPDRDVLGMSSGPFSGVNATLGLVMEMENRIAGLEADSRQMRRALAEVKDKAATMENGGPWAAGVATLCLGAMKIKIEN